MLSVLFVILCFFLGLTPALAYTHNSGATSPGDTLLSNILPVTKSDLFRAMDILETSPTIQTRDAFHAAVMLNNDLLEIISTDSHFDQIPGIRRLDPGRIST